jgi:hypothetical protein
MDKASLFCIRCIKQKGKKDQSTNLMEFPLLITYINKMDVFSYLLILLGNIENKNLKKTAQKFTK